MENPTDLMGNHGKSILFTYWSQAQLTDLVPVKASGQHVACVAPGTVIHVEHPGTSMKNIEIDEHKCETKTHVRNM